MDIERIKNNFLELFKEPEDKIIEVELVPKPEILQKNRLIAVTDMVCQKCNLMIFHNRNHDLLECLGCDSFFRLKTEK